MSANLNPPAYRLLMTADAVGGVWRYAIEAARALTQADVAVTLATFGPRATAEQQEEAAAIGGLVLIETDEPLDWLCDSRADVRQAAGTLAQLTRLVGADLVQLNGTALAADAVFEAPVVAVHHSCLATWWASVRGGQPPIDWSWRRDLTRDHLRRARAVAAPTRAFASETAATYGLSETPRVIFNGRSAIAAPVSASAPEVFTAGRLWDEGKNVETLERAANSIAAPVFAAGPLVGPQGAQVALRSTHALGMLSEPGIRARLARRPIFASVPLYEPFGLAVLEAAQAGCALILSDIATLRELWDGAAIFVPARNDRALAQAANCLLCDARLRESLATAARQRSLTYSNQRFGQALLAWHRDILCAGVENAA